MSPDPFIRDAAFRGSLILSYGTANRGSAWPKVLALAAGIFVLVTIAVLSWFWFFTRIPIPKNAVVFTVLPAGAFLNTNAPLVWKQAQALNNPLPTVAGLAKTAKTGSFLQDDNLGYAIRLSPATAIIGRTRLWDLVADQKLEVDSYKSPFDIFGWPWEMFNGQMKLEVAVRDLFSSGDFSWDDLPDRVNGVVVGNKWKTSLPLGTQKSVSEQTEDEKFVSGFVSLDKGTPDVLQNFLRYHGAWADLENQGDLTWKFDPSLVTVGYKSDEEQNLALASFDSEGLVITQPFELEDGEIVQRLYMMPGGATSTNVSTTDTVLGISVEQSGMGIRSNSVSGLTCEGDVLARFDHQSLQNFCSWIDICYFDFSDIVLINDGGYLTACGY